MGMIIQNSKQYYPVYNDSEIKALPTVSTASGSVATFDTDMTENLVSCVCEVASGSSEINVSACGKNLYNINNQTVTSINTVCFMYLPSNSYITFSTDIVQTGLYAYYYDNGNWVEITRIYNTSSLTFNTGNHTYINLKTYNEGTQATEFQMELGTTATAYTPYNGTSVNIPFGETLSGDGTFDVLSGILTRSDDTTSQLSANYIQTLNGINNIWCDTGDTEVKYLLTVGKKIS